MDAKTIKAEFGVFLKRSRAPTARPTLLIISKLEKRQVGIIKKTVQTRQLTLDTESTGRWYRFSTDRIVKDWVQNPNKNLGLQVEAYDYDGTQLAIVQTDNEREEPYVGFYVCIICIQNVCFFYVIASCALSVLTIIITLVCIYFHDQ